MSKENVQLSVSYMEIYKDEVYDLLVPRDNVCYTPYPSEIPLSPNFRLGTEASRSRESRRNGFCCQLIHRRSQLC